MKIKIAIAMLANLCFDMMQLRDSLLMKKNFLEVRNWEEFVNSTQSQQILSVIDQDLIGFEE